jgi:hypothetical protein
MPLAADDHVVHDESLEFSPQHCSQGTGCTEMCSDTIPAAKTLVLHVVEGKILNSYAKWMLCLLI